MSLYESRGVSASKSDVHKAIKSMDKGLFPQAFCKILPDYVAGDEAYCNIMHADTAGTKTSLAYIYWKETGDLSIWEGIVQDAIVMNVDDMACVGCYQDIILSSTIGRNKHLIPGEVLKELIGASKTFVDKMADQGIRLHLSGGETADVGDIVRSLDVGFTSFARMKRNDLVVNNMQDGDVIVGFASYGQSTYESEYNGGMGSNGLTSARHDLFHKSYATKYPESFDPNTSLDVVYTGSKTLTDKIRVEDQDIDFGKLVLSPTRTYLPLLKAIFDAKIPVNGIIHCTGGGQTKVMKFVDNKHVIKDELFVPPPLFQMIESESPITRREMYEVFNMGHRLEIYTSPSEAQALIDVAADFKIDAKIIGRVEDAPENKLTIIDENDVVYNH